MTSADVDGEVRTWNVQHGCMVGGWWLGVVVDGWGVLARVGSLKD